MSRMAEQPQGAGTFHVVRGDRYACGCKRTDRAPVHSSCDASTVPPHLRCLRIGCSNDYAKADREARP